MFRIERTNECLLNKIRDQCWVKNSLVRTRENCEKKEKGNPFYFSASLRQVDNFNCLLGTSTFGFNTRISYFS